VGHLSIEVENTSDDFTTFSPQLLVFLDKDNNQENIIGQYAGSVSVGSESTASVVAAGDLRIWPRARIKHFYKLPNRVHLPARLYYGEKLLATIID
jgi:hypothetical protein